jgi:nitrite reductase/ring-hydroxylating ferredoxin subunit
MSEAPKETTQPSAPPSAGGPASPPRRDFLAWLSTAFLGLWGIGAATVVSSFLGSPEREKRIAENTVRVGLLDDLAVGEARLVRHGTSPFWIYRKDAEHVIALAAICTHMRCVLDFDRRERQMVCPCHDGRFDLDGNVISGPPPRPLASYPVAIRSGEMFVQL